MRKEIFRRALLLGALSITSTAEARLMTDCGAAELIAVDSKTGRTVARWSVPGMSTNLGPLLLSKDDSAVFGGFQVCRDSRGNVVRTGVLEEHEGGVLASAAITLALPELRPIKTAQPGPEWKQPLRSLVSDDLAVSYFGKSLFFDRTEEGEPLKLYSLMNKPTVHRLDRPWKTALVKDLYLGAGYACVYIEQKTLYCYDANSGDLLWKWSHDGPTDSAGAGNVISLYDDESSLYVASTESGLFALEPATGKVRWRIPYYNAWSVPPSILKAGNLLVIGPIGKN